MSTVSNRTGRYGSEFEDSVYVDKNQPKPINFATYTPGLDINSEHFKSRPKAMIYQNEIYNKEMISKLNNIKSKFKQE